MKKQVYMDMQWTKSLRRDEDNIFNALFLDKEAISDDEVEAFVLSTAKFFDIAVPEVFNFCKGLAEIKSKGDKDNKLFYNMRNLQEIGINNKDAFKLLLTHELCHLVFRNACFGCCLNESWNHEMMCDFVAGIRAELEDIASGKYKYAVHKTPPSITHPAGSFRKHMVEEGRSIAIRYKETGEAFNLYDIIDPFLSVMEKYAGQLNDEWQRFIISSDEPIKIATRRPVEELPESNLLRQAIERYRNNQKNREN